MKMIRVMKILLHILVWQIYKKQKFMELTTEDESAPTRLLFFDLNDIVG